LRVFWSGFVISLGVIGIFYEMFGLEEPFGYFALIAFASSVAIFVSYVNVAYKNYKVMLFENFVTTMGVFSSLMYLFSGLFISLSSVVLLKLYHDPNILGDFQVVVKSVFFSLVAVFVFPLNTYMFPEISKLISQQKFGAVKHLERKLLKYLTVFFVVLVIGTFFTKFVISFVFPETYWKSYKMLNMMLPFLPFIAYTTFALNIIKGANRFGLALLVRICGSIVFFMAVFLLYLLDYGAVYIVVALNLAFVSMAGLSFYYKRQIV